MPLDCPAECNWFIQLSISLVCAGGFFHLVSTWVLAEQRKMNIYSSPSRLSAYHCSDLVDVVMTLCARAGGCDVMVELGLERRRLSEHPELCILSMMLLQGWRSESKCLAAVTVVGPISAWGHNPQGWPPSEWASQAVVQSHSCWARQRVQPRMFRDQGPWWNRRDAEGMASGRERLFHGQISCWAASDLAHTAAVHMWGPASRDSYLIWAKRKPLWSGWRMFPALRDQSYYLASLKSTASVCFVRLGIIKVNPQPFL